MYHLMHFHIHFLLLSSQKPFIFKILILIKKYRLVLEMRLKERVQRPTALESNSSQLWRHVRALKIPHGLATSQTSETRMSDSGAQASELYNVPSVASRCSRV